MSEAKARRWALEDHKVTVDEWIDIVEGLKIFERKAMAWDLLETKVIENINRCRERTSWWGNLCQFRIWMEKFLNPNPKTPLEELEEFVNEGLRINSVSSYKIQLDDVWREIQRLKEKK